MKNLSRYLQIKLKRYCINMVIVTTGMLYGENINPKKSLKDLSKDKSHKLFSLNTIAPAIVTKHFLSKLNKENKYIFSLRIV